jgi:hypothetical protein
MNSKPKNRKSLLFSTANEKSASNEELPKNKYTKEKPSNKKQEIKAPRTKYFSPASVANSEFL